MDEVAPGITALMGHHHPVSLRNGRPNDRKQPGIGWPETAFHLLDGWRLLRIFPENRAVDVIAESYFEYGSQICRNTSDIGVLAPSIGEGWHPLLALVHPKPGRNDQGRRQRPGPT